MLYLDTSALLKLYVLEEGSAEVQQVVQGQSQPLPVWEIQEMELTNALWSKVFRGELTAAAVEKQLSLFADRRRRGQYFFPELSRAMLMERFRELSQKTAESGCRTMDILHVACALEIKARSFISFDDRQNQLAAGAGLNLPPA